MSEAVELIKSELTKRSQDESKKIISEAEEKAKEIIASAKRKAREVMMASVKPEVEVMRRRILGSAMLEGRKMLLKIKYELVLKIEHAVEDRLRMIVNRKDDNVDYDKVLFNLLSEAITRLGEDEAIVTANQRDLSYMSKNLKKIERQLSKSLGHPITLSLTKKPQNIIGGIIVQSKDGLKTFNNTLDGRLQNMESILRGKILKTILD